MTAREYLGVENVRYPFGFWYGRLPILRKAKYRIMRSNWAAKELQDYLAGMDTTYWRKRK